MCVAERARPRRGGGAGGALTGAGVIADDLAKAKELQEKFKQKDFELKQDQFNELVQDEAASPDDIFVTLCKDNGVCDASGAGGYLGDSLTPGTRARAGCWQSTSSAQWPSARRGRTGIGSAVRARGGGNVPHEELARFRAGPALTPPRLQLSSTRSTSRARVPSHTTRRCVRVAVGTVLGPVSCRGLRLV